MVTEYFLNMILGNVFHSADVMPLPDRYYVALSATMPNGDGSGVAEPSGGAYSRAVMTSMGPPSGGVISNAEDIEFPESTDNWGMITAYVIYDAAVGGNVLAFDSLTTAQDIVADNQARFKSGAIKITLENKQ